MIWSEARLPDPQCPLVQRLRLRIVTFAVVGRCEVVEGGCDIGVIWSEARLSDPQCPLCERYSLVVSSCAVQANTFLVQALCLVQTRGWRGVLPALDAGSACRCHVCHGSTTE